MRKKCSLVHPTVLHIRAKHKVLVPHREEELWKDENLTVISGYLMLF